MPTEFLGPANKLVYYLAIPALIFRSVSKASFRTQFNPTVLLVTLGSAILAYAGAWIIGRSARWPQKRIGSFIQCAAHGNHGYIGLPVSFYFLGEAGLAKASILAGFLMILQNILSVLALQTYSVADDKPGKRLRVVVEKLVQHPVIVSAFAGVLVSLFELPIPTSFQRFLDILSGLAPPMSLLLIGASLSFHAMRGNLAAVFGAAFIKIILLPIIGMLLFLELGVGVGDALPALILLATPTATVAYVMSKEMNGDPEFAGAAVSLSTLISAVTYLIWLTIVGNGIQA